MRTKTLLLSAALSAACIASAMAQGTVYSVNVVGYVKVDLAAGFTMIANPLNAPTNTIAALLPDVPDGTVIYKFDSTKQSFTINSKDFGEWSLPNDTLAPGEGAFIKVTAPVTVTFVGEVMQGSLSTPIPAGFSIKSSQVPLDQVALSNPTVSTDPQQSFPAVDGDVVYRFNPTTQAYSIISFDFGAWSVVPTPKLGEAFFVKKAAATTWTRTFTVPQ
jgi:hypothetical protein